MGEPCAIGRLDPDGPWVGFTHAADGGYQLVAGHTDGLRSAPADPDLLLALAIVYFENVLEDPPPSLEATHADMSELVRWVAAGAEDEPARRLLSEAVDAIDDGLGEDEVIGRLVAARRAPREQADPLGLLRERVGALGAES
jgi:hypothetical protein